MEREESSATAPPENESEMRLYLDKLKEIVPKCPKHRKVTRLELIQHVIDYICDLQQALEERANLRGTDRNFLTHHEAEAIGTLWKNGFGPRQPLGVLPQAQNIPDSGTRLAQNRASSGYRRSLPFSSSFSGAENG